MPTINLTDAVRGYAYSVSLTSSFGTPPYTYSLWSGSLPGGLSLSSGGTISGTPTATTGTYLFDVLATSSTATTQTDSYSLLVLPEITLTPTTLPDAVQNTAYSQQLTAQGGTGGYTWTVQSGTLPSGITLSSGGLVSGTTAWPPGAYNFIARVTDSSAHSLDWSFVIRITASAGGGTPPTYLLSVNTTTVTEGGQIVYSIATTDFGNGFLYWKNLGTTQAQDFNDGLNQGSVEISADQGQLVRRIANDFTSEIVETVDIRLYSGSLTGPLVASTGTVSVQDTSSSTRDLMVGIPILADDYNRIQTRAEEILGLGLDGYGLAAVRSTPVADSNIITRVQWNNLLSDLNSIHTHVQGTNTTYSSLTTSTVSITTSRPTDLYTITNQIYFNENLRYSCYPGGTYPTQFFNEGGSDTTYRFGISTTTNTVWYGSCNTVFRMRWVTGLLARHFFNAGGQIVWEPVFGPGPDASISDAEWAEFLTLYRAGGYDSYVYQRSDWVTTATTKITTYSSGTKEIIITAEKNLTTDIDANQFPDRIKFTAQLRDTALDDFVITPTGYRLVYGNTGTVEPPTSPPVWVYNAELGVCEQASFVAGPTTTYATQEECNTANGVGGGGGGGGGGGEIP